jgi:hypothetical protein
MKPAGPQRTLCRLARRARVCRRLLALAFLPLATPSHAQQVIKLDLSALPGSTTPYRVVPGSEVIVRVTNMAPGQRDKYRDSVRRETIALATPIATPALSPGATTRSAQLLQARSVTENCAELNAAVQKLALEKAESSVASDVTNIRSQASSASPPGCPDTTKARLVHTAADFEAITTTDLSIGAVDAGVKVTVSVRRDDLTWTVVVDGGPANGWITTFGLTVISDVVDHQVDRYLVADTTPAGALTGKATVKTAARSTHHFGVPSFTLAYSVHIPGWWEDHGLGPTPLLTAGYRDGDPVIGVGLGILYRDFLLVGSGFAFHQVYGGKPAYPDDISVVSTTSADALVEKRGAWNPFVVVSGHLSAAIFGGAGGSGASGH